MVVLAVVVGIVVLLLPGAELPQHLRGADAGLAVVSGG